jgi:hypothetical protein
MSLSSWLALAAFAWTPSRGDSQLSKAWGITCLPVGLQCAVLGLFPRANPLATASTLQLWVSRRKQDFLDVLTRRNDAGVRTSCRADDHANRDPA